MQGFDTETGRKAAVKSDKTQKKALLKRLGIDVESLDGWKEENNAE